MSPKKNQKNINDGDDNEEPGANDGVRSHFYTGKLSQPKISHIHGQPDQLSALYRGVKSDNECDLGYRPNIRLC